MSLYQQFANYADLNPPTTFDSPLTLSALSPLNSTSDSVDHLASIDLSAYGTSTSTSENFSLNPNSVERILHLPHAYSPVTPPDRSHQQMNLPRLGTSSTLTNGKVNSITTSVIVANSSITSSTTATMSKATGPTGAVTSSTVSTIVMQSTEKNNQSSSSSSFSSNQSQNNVLCLICGDVPLGKNFGVVTCGSCKIFFRRNIIFADKVCTLIRCNT